MTTTSHFGTADQLATYTASVLSQVLAVMQPYLDGSRSGYAEHMGPHIRHVIEHYETLAHALHFTPADLVSEPLVDYDARQRDVLVETNPRIASGRIQQLLQTLATTIVLVQHGLTKTVRVHVRGGVLGEHNFQCMSTLARELMFLNSHTTHHFAVMQGYAKQRGESLGDGLGKAPSTVAHEIKQRAVQHANT